MRRASSVDMLIKHAITVGAIVGLTFTGCGSDDAAPSSERSTVHAGSFEVPRANADQELEELKGIEVITGSLAISRATSLAPLSALVHVQGDVVISNNPELASLSGLEHLTQIDGDLILAANDSLSSLSALEALEEVGGSLELAALTNLEDLTGLDKLKHVGGDLSVHGNDALIDLTALGALTAIGGSFELDRNSALVSARLGLEWSEGPDIAGTFQALHNPSLEELDHFGTFTARTGSCDLGRSDLWVAGNDQLQSIALPSRLLRACIEIFDNPALTTISGGDSGPLASLTLLELPSLSVLDLHHSEVQRALVSKTGLSSLSGLGKVSCRLWIDNNPELTELGELASYPGQVAQGLSIRDNPKLAQCAIDAMLTALPEPTLLCVDPTSGTAPNFRSVDTANNDDEASCEAQMAVADGA